MSTIRTFARSHPLLVTAVGLAIGLAVIWFVPSDGSLANMMFIRLGLTIVMFAIMAVAAGCNIIVPNAKSIGLSFKKSIYPLVVALVMGVFVLLGTAMKNEGMVSDWPLQLALVIMLCLLVGTFEEGLFRGIVFSGLLARFGETRRGLIGAVIVSSLIFGFVHVTPSIMNGQVVTGLDMAQAALKTLQAGILGAFLAALFLKEPVTNKKVLGIFCGAIGALLLILGNGHATQKGNGSLTGDLLCLTAQCSFAVYLTIFKKLIQKYTVVTCMKWMFTYATIVILPFTYKDLAILPWAEIPPTTWFETAFVVFVATYLAYIMMMTGQKLLRPTIVSMYNYVQPIVACIVSVATGLGVFGWSQGAAVLLVFGGVWLVTQSKSRADLKSEHASPTDPKS